MPIIAKRIQANIYLEPWDGVILPEHLGASARERHHWLKVDGADAKYCVLVDLSKTATLPKPRALKEAAKEHPEGTPFIIFGVSSPFFSSIAGLVRMAGLQIWTADNLEAAIAKAQELLAAAGDQEAQS